MTEVKLRDNGPIIITGDFTVFDPEGKAYEKKDTVFLCRCGQSNNKPFCDATHRSCGFENAPRA